MIKSPNSQFIIHPLRNHLSNVLQNQISKIRPRIEGIEIHVNSNKTSATDVTGAKEGRERSRNVVVLKTQAKKELNSHGGVFFALDLPSNG